MKDFTEIRNRVLSDPAARAIYEDRKRKLVDALSLGELRKARELTQVQLADAIGTTQSGISRIEHQTDLYVRTLRSYIEAMGGFLEINAVFPDNPPVPISSFEDFGEETADSGAPIAMDAP